MIIAYFGASNLPKIMQQSTPRGLGVPKTALDLLLGGQLEQEQELAMLASPVFRVDRSDPPLLLLHGDPDPQVPINQSHELYGKCRSLGLPVDIRVLHGAAHSGDQFYDEARTTMVSRFLASCGI